MLSYILGIIVTFVTFCATISWMIIRGKIREEIHSIWTTRMKEYDDSKEEGREARRQALLNNLGAIKETIKEDKEERKESREETLQLLKSISDKLGAISDLQIEHDVKINNLENKR